MKILLSFLAIVFLVVFLLFFYTWFRLHQELHLHVALDQTQVSASSLKLSTQYLTSSSGQKIAYWYLPVKNSKAVVILVHGFRVPTGGKSMMLGVAQFLNEAGYSTFLLDLRSQGNSPGNQVTLGAQEWQDVVTAEEFLRAQPENKDQKIGYFGVSMGAVTSLIAQGEAGKADFVIASVPFATYNRLFRYQIAEAGFSPTLFTPLMDTAAHLELGWNYQKYEPLDEVKKIKVPVLFMRAEHDQSVNSEDAKILYDATSGPKEFWSAPTGHDIFSEQPQEFKTKVLEFLQRYAE